MLGSTHLGTSKGLSDTLRDLYHFYDTILLHALQGLQHGDQLQHSKV